MDNITLQEQFLRDVRPLSEYRDRLRIEDICNKRAACSVPDGTPDNLVDPEQQQAIVLSCTEVVSALDIPMFRKYPVPYTFQYDKQPPSSWWRNALMTERILRPYLTYGLAHARNRKCGSTETLECDAEDREILRELVGPVNMIKRVLRFTKPLSGMLLDLQLCDCYSDAFTSMALALVKAVTSERVPLSEFYDVSQKEFTSAILAMNPADAHSILCAHIVACETLRNTCTAPIRVLEALSSFVPLPVDIMTSVSVFVKQDLDLTEHCTYCNTLRLRIGHQ